MMMESPTRVGMLRLGRTRSYTSIMKIDPDRYSTLIKPLSRAALRKAPRQEATILRGFLRELVMDIASGRLRHFGAWAVLRDLVRYSVGRTRRERLGADAPGG